MGITIRRLASALASQNNLNIVDIGKFAHKIISVTFLSGTTEASLLIFGTEHQYGELYRVTQHVHFLFDATLNIQKK